MYVRVSIYLSLGAYEGHENGLQRNSVDFYMAVLDRLGDKGLEKNYVNGLPGRWDETMRTPRRLLDLFPTCIYRLLEPLDTSSKQAQAAVLGICIVSGDLKE